jgi:hypothetical protein
LRQLQDVLHKACVSLVGSLAHSTIEGINGLLAREKPLFDVHVSFFL